MASSCPDVRRAKAMDQCDGKIAEGGHNLWSIAGSAAGAVFPEGDIAYILRAVLDAPMPAIEVQQALWTGLARSKSGDKIDHLAGSLAGFGHGAGELSDLRDKGPARSEMGIHLGTHLDGAHLEASLSTVNSLRLQVARLRVRKIGRQVRVERGLIAFDGQDRLALQLMHQAHELDVGMQGISGTHPAFGWARSAGPPWRPGSHWFSRPRALARTFPGCDGYEISQQVGSGLLAQSRSPHSLPVQCQRLVGGERRGGFDPASQPTPKGAGIQLRQQPAIQRATRGHKQSGTK